MDDLLLLKNILCYSHKTEYGKLHNTEQIDSIDEFKNIVPIVTYDDIDVFIEKQYSENTNSIVNQSPIYWTLTSGHSSVPKRIPVTEISLNTYLSAITPLFKNVMSEFGEFILKGKILPLVGKYEIGKTPTGISIGTISGLLMKTAAKNLSPYFALNLECADLLPIDQRWTYFVENSIKSDIRCIFVANPAYVIKLLELGMQINYNQKLRDIENGYRLWPNLKVIICQTGGASAFHVSKLKKYFPNTFIWDPGIGGSEGYFCSPTFCDNAIGIPNNNHYFLEFKEYNSQLNNTYLFNQLEYEKLYELIVTTNYGFLRYNTFDIFKKTSESNLLFCGRSSFEVSFFGERITELQVDESIKRLFTKYRIFNGSFYLEANSKSKEYTLNLIFQTENYSNLLALENSLRNDFDIIMQDINVNYKYSRILYNVLEMPKINLIDDNTFELLSNISKPYLMAQEKTKHLILI